MWCCNPEKLPLALAVIKTKYCHHFVLLFRKCLFFMWIWCFWWIYRIFHRKMAKDGNFLFWSMPEPMVTFLGIKNNTSPLAFFETLCIYTNAQSNLKIFSGFITKNFILQSYRLDPADLRQFTDCHYGISHLHVLGMP